MTKVGIVGCGTISKFHYEGYERAGAKVVHVCDLNIDAAKSVATRYGARVSTDYRTLIDDPEVQIVSVTTYSKLHKEVALAAIAAGKGVVCEKTLTDSAGSSAELATAADKAGTFFTIGYMKRYFPAVQQAKTLLTDMGQIISIHARTWQAWDWWNCEIPKEYRNHPSGVINTNGGGILVAGGSHILDLLHFLAGRPTNVCGQMYIREGLDFDTRANAMMWLKDGGIANLEACWHPMSYAGYERNGWDERIEINTAKGRLDLATPMWNKPTSNGALLVHQDAATGRTTEYRYPALNPFDIEMAEVVRRFECGEPGSPSAWDGYVVDELISQITKSAQTQTVCPMIWRDR
ncbi:MAG: Gfo/Idh/MocA family oxidoreductase [Armatimonadota bacterium]|nr:Gfo/Idh/MocA family oxidoreductase [bacterium]